MAEETIKCPKCGTECNNTEKFCGNCGCILTNNAQTCIYFSICICNYLGNILLFYNISCIEGLYGFVISKIYDF